MLFSTTAGQFRNRPQHTRQQQGKSTCRALTVPCESITIRDLLLKTLTGHLINFATALAQKAICCKDMHLETHCIKLKWLAPATNAAVGLASLIDTGFTVEHERVHFDGRHSAQED